MKLLASWFVALILTVLLMGIAVAASEPSCDRACLQGIMDSYLAALLARDPSRAPIGLQAKSTENTVLVKPGEGVWKTASGFGTYKVNVADPEAGQAVFI